MKKNRFDNDTYSWSTNRGFSDQPGSGSTLLIVAAFIYGALIIGVLIAFAALSIRFLGLSETAGGRLNVPGNAKYIEVREYTPETYGYTLAEIAQKLSPSTVQLQLATDNSFDQGSPVFGAVIAEKGYIVSTSPRLADANGLRVVAPNGNTYSAVIVGRDNATGVTVIKCSYEKLTPVIIGTAALPGDRIIINGCSSLGQTVHESSLLSGMASSYYRVGEKSYTVKSLMADYSPDPSGGLEPSSGFAAVDKSGCVVGFYCPMLGSPGTALISARETEQIAQSIIQHGHVAGRYRVGFSADPVAGDLLQLLGGGITVTHIETESPAYILGLRTGDVIVSAGGIPLSTQEDLWQLAQKSDGAVIHAKVYLAEKQRLTDIWLRFIEDNGTN